MDAIKAAYVVNADSSRTWKTPEVAILSCPNETELCGADRVVTVTDTAGSLTLGDGTTALTKDLNSCSWLLKSVCKPITIGYDATSSTGAGFAVNWIVLPASAVTNDKVVEFAFTDAKTELLGAAVGASRLYPFVQEYSSG